jgi:hypothetical protein
VRDSYPDLWGEKNKLMTKVSINVLNGYLAERLSYAWQLGFLEDIFEVEQVEKNVSTMLKLVPDQFWRADWSIRVQDNANVRSIIASDLEMLTSNVKMKRTWHEGLVLPVVGSSDQMKPAEDGATT